MKYLWKYETPDGFDDLVMSGEGETLTGLWFASSRRISGEMREEPVFRVTCRWLDEYFSGRVSDFTPKFRIDGLTPFRKDVLDELMLIPFGSTASYGDIAKAISKKHGARRVSAQAVGGAVGWNPVCIIIPCHRVIGADGALTGYSGGLDNKMSLLAHERKFACRRLGGADSRRGGRGRSWTPHEGASDRPLAQSRGPRRLAAALA